MECREGNDSLHSVLVSALTIGDYNRSRIQLVIRCYKGKKTTIAQLFVLVAAFQMHTLRGAIRIFLLYCNFTTLFVRRAETYPFLVLLLKDKSKYAFLWLNQCSLEMAIAFHSTRVSLTNCVSGAK